MNRRTFLTAFALPVSAALVLVACGDNASGDRPDVDGTDPTTTAPPTTVPPTTVPPTTQPPTTTEPPISHPTGAKDVVLELRTEGGFVAPGTLFVRFPTLLITGDGSVYTPGVQTEIFPQPLVPPVMVGHIGEARLQELLKAAREGKMFRQVTYATNNSVADAPNTVLVLNVDGTTYTHDAYALGFSPDGKESDPDRKAFADFVIDVLGGFTAEDTGAKPFQATQYAIRASVADPAQPSDPKPNEIAWPADAGVKLADAAECAVVTADKVATTFAQATQITRFIEGDQKYVLAVRPMLPGDAGC